MAKELPSSLTTEAIVARMPRILRYLAATMRAGDTGDLGYTLQAPADLPLDEGTYTGLIFLTTQLADAAGVTADDLDEWAVQAETAQTP